MAKKLSQEALANKLEVTPARLIRIQQIISKAEYIPEIFGLPNDGEGGFDGATLRFKASTVGIDIVEGLARYFKTSKEAGERRTNPFGYDAQIIDLELINSKEFEQDFAGSIRFYSGVKELLRQWKWARENSSPVDLPFSKRSEKFQDFYVRLETSSRDDGRASINIMADGSNKVADVVKIISAAGIDFEVKDTDIDLPVYNKGMKVSPAGKFLAAYQQHFYSGTEIKVLDNLAKILHTNKSVARA